ncbi:hypothetical protein [Bradyrhizobium japonicum]|uniref:hypothetical protein n=1 Tax=Bradyrhizobium japonicum TaxID=375 RepID=UPI00200ED7BF|nr:hypothetical protein [Bradyrhizobium japonicum]UQE03402.1 hypothetical protein JEY30_48880 [Bradyrhizobium japonicum]
MVLALLDEFQAELGDRDGELCSLATQRIGALVQDRLRRLKTQPAVILCEVELDRSLGFSDQRRRQVAVAREREGLDLAALDRKLALVEAERHVDAGKRHRI